MSYRRRQNTDAIFGDSLSKTKRLAAVSSIRFVRRRYTIWVLPLLLLVALAYPTHALCLAHLGICMNCRERERCDNPEDAPRAHSTCAQPNRDSCKSGSQRVPTGTIAEYQEPAEEEHECNNQTDFCDAISHERPLKPPNDPSSATRPTRRVDCNQNAMAGFAAAHG